MATLATLKLSTAVKPTHMPAVQVRRNKMSRRLWEQIELARAQQAERSHVGTAQAAAARAVVAAEHHQRVAGAGAALRLHLFQSRLPGAAFGAMRVAVAYSTAPMGASGKPPRSMLRSDWMALMNPSRVRSRPARRTASVNTLAATKPSMPE